PPLALADTELAMRALDRGDYISAYRQLDALARAGDPVAQYNLGFMYYGGEGIPQDDQQAFYWFNRAARSGHAPSQDVLAYMYNHGRGVEQDKIRAYVWYSIAAANGIFLAESIRDKLARELGNVEQIQADIMVEDYLKHYQSRTDD
ncbi:MAG: tetratricopeptide repeat protein, partial [Gammaproteobacteria bacterium]|nr:tetratricopeptide repeat protein [Gammaproteobacteria bacterium]